MCRNNAERKCPPAPPAARGGKKALERTNEPPGRGVLPLQGIGWGGTVARILGTGNNKRLSGIPGLPEGGSAR